VTCEQGQFLTYLRSFSEAGLWQPLLLQPRPVLPRLLQPRPVLPRLLQPRPVLPRLKSEGRELAVRHRDVVYA
jgi:hypothetical protein